jgi:hypothetical protein
MIELLKSDDDRVRLMAADKIYEHAWCRPKEYDPVSEKASEPEFNPRDYTPKRLKIIEAAF